MLINKPWAPLCAILLALPVVSRAAAPPLACPASLATSSINMSDVDGGWEPFVKAPVYLFSASVIDGPPQRMGDLVPSGERRRKGTWSSTYDLEGPFPEGKWLQCAYGEHNQLTLSRRLPDATTACTFTYRKGEKAGQNKITIACR